MVLAILLGGVGVAAWAMGRVGWGKDEEGRRRNEEGKTEGGKNDKFRIGDLRKGGNRGWVVLGVACVAMVMAHGWFWWRASMAPAPKAAMLAPAESGDFQTDENVPQEILGVLGPDEYRYIRELRDGVPGKVAGYHFYWRPRKGNANQLYHRPDRCMPGAGWRIEGKVERQRVRLGGREFIFNVFPFRGPGGPALMLWGSFLNGEPVEIEFNNDVYLNTANLAQFIRTGTRTYSYEVAALIMPYEGARPGPEQIEAFANRIFTEKQQ
ncbi:MAG: exosortase-associated EpsI family protein [Chthoniobacterales bacterium]